MRMTRRAFLAAALSLVAGWASADTSTSRLGLVKPSTGTYFWGTKVNGNFDIMDSSAAALRQPNVFLASGTWQNANGADTYTIIVTTPGANFYGLDVATTQRVGIGLASTTIPTEPLGLDTSGYVRTRSGFRVNSSSGTTLVCPSGQSLNAVNVLGGLTLGGTCAASGAGDVTQAGNNVMTGNNSFSGSTTFYNQVDLSSQAFNVSASSCTLGFFGFSTTQTSFLVAFSTLTITTHGGRVRMIFTGAIGNDSNGARCLASVLQDGQYIAPWTSTIGMSQAMQSTSSTEPNINTQTFDNVTPTAPSAGSHSYSLTSLASSSTCRLSTSGGTYAQFCVKEE